MIERYEARETVVLKGEGLQVLENEESMQLDLAFEVLREGDALNTTDAVQLDAIPLLQRPIHPAGILVGDLRDDQLEGRLLHEIRLPQRLKILEDLGLALFGRKFGHPFCSLLRETCQVKKASELALWTLQTDEDQGSVDVVKIA